jgi:hypothetical protein
VTAEIALLNRSAVALASDSAVTIDTPTGPKIYEGANKIFALVKGRPVGVMIFDSADHLGVPWETIIKAYRMSRRDSAFPALEDYARDFLDFIANSSDLIPAELHDDYLDELAAQRTRQVVDIAGAKANEYLRTQRALTKTSIRRFIGEAISEQRKEWADRADGPWAALIDVAGLAKSNRARVENVIARTLQNLPATTAHRTGIRTLIFESLAKVPSGAYGPIDPRSGVVIAGFGEKEFFPRLIPYDIYGAIDGQLRAAPDTKVEISVANSAVIAPFAQREMVDGFMTGLNPVVEAGLAGYFDGVTTSFPKATIDLLKRQVSSIDSTVESSLSGPLTSLVQVMVRELRQYLARLQESQFRPIVDSVAYLPKDELAAMAESLVNLTSLKRRVSIDDPQTVGGPVDVAVISRGDGFVWIKRKHYFSQELNPSWATMHSRSSAE